MAAAAVVGLRLETGELLGELQAPITGVGAVKEVGHFERVSLEIHTHVREDALQLYGFSTRGELETFELLIGISGVGPRLALAVLSGIGSDELHAAVVRRDRERLQKIPGVGKKTAERVLLELRDKLGVPDVPAGDDLPDDDVVAGAASGVRHDAVSALVNLGYSSQVASRAVARAFDDANEAPPAALICC